MPQKIVNAYCIPYSLKFKNPSGTSRGVLTHKPSFFIFLVNKKGVTGIGECNIIPGLSPDENPELESVIDKVCEDVKSEIDLDTLIPATYPGLRFAVETALLDMQSGGKRELFQTDFVKGKKRIPINGLVWMGSKDDMLRQAKEKIESYFKCIKFKIGAIEWKTELEMLKALRSQFNQDELEIRVDANGAFSTNKVMKVLEELGKLKVHSIEQPIAKGNWEDMAELCRNTPVPIALDEELIGLKTKAKKEELMQAINPQYIILKPSLVGGLKECEEWVEVAERLNAGWWATSALESNIGLNAIAQWCAAKNTQIPQGLGTGQLFTNNFPSPLEMKASFLEYNPVQKWDLSSLTQTA